MPKMKTSRSAAKRFKLENDQEEEKPQKTGYNRCYER